MPFKEKYNHFCANLTPSVESRAHVLEKARKQERPEKRPFRRAAAVLAVIALLTVCAVPVLAQNADKIYGMFQNWNMDRVQALKPVNLSDERNGIRMEVVSAEATESGVDIYISLKDLTGNRVDETIDLYDSYHLDKGFDGSAGCALDRFDEETQTAYFYIHIEHWNGESLKGKKVTFRLREFLYGKEVYNGVPIPLDLSALPEAESTIAGEIVRASPSGEQVDMAVLEPGMALPGFPVQGVDLTGAAFVDGKLHLQMGIYDRLRNDNHGYFYLVDEAGKKRNYSAQCYLDEGMGGGIAYYEDGSVEYEYARPDKMTYVEQVFDMGPKELENYKLFGYFVTGGESVQGNWEVTFPLA